MQVFPRDLHTQYHTSDLPGQFILSTDTAQIPDGWRTCSLGQWVLASHSALPFFEIQAGGAPVGWLLGYPIDLDGNIITSKVVLDECATNSVTPEQFETFLYRFGGRYAAVLLSGVTGRVYLDPCGSLAVVYCPSQKLVASTPSLIPYGPDVYDDDELITTLGFPDSAEMLPLGLTAKVGVERLLPNHYLDLDKWCSVRHWPSGPIQEVRDIRDAIARIATRVRRTIGAVALRCPHLALTAGQDSRMLLACAREFADVLTCFTTLPRSSLAAQVDCDVANRMCQRFALKHILLRFQGPRSYEVGEWLFRTGFSLGTQSNWQGASAVRQLNPQRVDLSGHIGELARADYWRAEDPSAEEVTSARLTAICGFPLNSTTQPRFQKWLARLPFLEPDRILDFLYLEQRLGCWAGIMPYGVAEDGQFQVFPLCHREIIELMLALPRSYRWNGSLPIDIIRREWPELLEYPINTPMGMQRAWAAVERVKTSATRNVAYLMKAVRNPDWAIQKVIERTKYRSSKKSS
jgi:hypothetical protein